MSYSEKFKRRSSDYLISNYLNCNAEYRKITRDELRKRHKIRELNLYLGAHGRKRVKGKVRRRKRQGWQSNVFMRF